MRVERSLGPDKNELNLLQLIYVYLNFNSVRGDINVVRNSGNLE